MSLMHASLTDQSYWDAVWAGGEVPRVDPSRDPHQRELERRFRRWLGPGRRFLEVGVGGSAWPAWVARELGAEAWGIDFSWPGLLAAQRAADRAGVSVRLVEGDLFDAELLPKGKFDVVYSGGFVEHFEEPAPVMQRLAELLVGDGVVLTTVPNFGGLNGRLQRWADPACFARHVVFTRASLDGAHATAGLRPVEPARYLGAMDVASVNWGRRMSARPKLVQALLWRGMRLSSRAAHGVMRMVRGDSGGRLLAPSILGVYGKGRPFPG
jgi:2-polyprenyl-3-methyl-5-hydroxy-6-metoxy-1,4-benzoquinol methylase